MINQGLSKEYISMNWTKDALFSKAKILIEKAFREDQDSMFFGLFCSLALELLARAAVANIHPTLLAETDSKQKNLLYALGKDDSISPKSIAMTKVVDLCAELIPAFTDDLKKLTLAMIERRNEELHSGGAAFEEYNQDKWIGEFYKACKVLTKSMGESLESFLGKEHSGIAESLLSENDAKIKKAVLDKIAARKKTFQDDEKNIPDIISERATKSDRQVESKVHQGFHKVSCPCCNHSATIYGKESSSSQEKIIGDSVKVTKTVIPTMFQCDVCGLKLSSYAELQAASLPLHYTNTYEYDPIDYFGIDMDKLSDSGFYEEYSNE